MQLIVRYYKVKNNDNLIPTDEQKLVDLSNTELLCTEIHPCPQDEKISNIIDKIQKNIADFKGKFTLETGEEIVESIELNLD